MAGERPVMQLDRTTIDQALAQASTTRYLALERGALDRAGEAARTLVPDRPAVLIADATTWEIAGEAVHASLAAAGVPVAAVVRLTGSPQVKPDLETVAIAHGALTSQPGEVLPIAIGSGTINDVVKRAAYEAGLPYLVVATAASMDGYTASGAALIADGVKQTFGCDAPVGVIADPAILAAAPPAMTASGYGDLLGKLTAGADWLIAAALRVEPIDRAIWDSVQGPLRAMLADPDRYATGDEAAIETLFLALANSGLAIQATGSSRPASGSEHQFSHYWEMRGLEVNGLPVSHGFKVGLGSILSAAFTGRLLERDFSGIDVQALVRSRSPWDMVAAEIMRIHALPAIRDKALEEMEAKYVSDETLAPRLELVRARWGSLRDALRAHLMAPQEIAALLAGAGCPVTPEEIGLTREDIRASYLAATHIRRRYTVYDLAMDLGVFHEIVDELFAAGGYWSGSRA